ncbi:endonuclease domain-containing protein [Hymenobacter sp. BT186]|uniref:Endonuclease domain-containing protein n=1 Tax=Hymenobacter telluris TaxID=2816474 RepID=A0A939EYR7_9BACT|nr:endonuclease domain-containing protein [Hymenobacter telluris]MBO0359642.1 endonuclease domain-containing protein [Hymenobacter telluris]MBW3375669.1 endonuclease domain-containing protein [Hymenobacter norwichensis]
MKLAHHNQPELKSTRKALRDNLTPAEATLWRALQNSQLDGRKFRRQHSIGNYVIDFYCPAERLAVELDGHGHYTVSGEAADMERTKFLQNISVRVVRFENKMVFEQIEFALEGIRQAFRNNDLTTPNPSLKKEGS